MSINQKSGHGTVIAVQLTPGGAFTDVAEMGDVTPPELSRNDFDGTTQTENIDSYVLGVLRRSDFTVPLNWIPNNNTHDHLTGVLYLMINNIMTGWRIRFGMVSPAIDWIMSGQVKGFKPTAPVDGKLAAELTIRPSGAMSIGATTIS